MVLTFKSGVIESSSSSDEDDNGGLIVGLSCSLSCNVERGSVTSKRTDCAVIFASIPEVSLFDKEERSWSDSVLDECVSLLSAEESFSSEKEEEDEVSLSEDEDVSLSDTIHEDEDSSSSSEDEDESLS